MSVIPYQPRTIDEPRALVDAIRKRRGGTLLNLDRMLLHSPPLAEGWNGFLRAIRSGLEIPAKLREIAICVVAILNGAEYEYRQHAPHFIEAGGTATQLDALQQVGTAQFDPSLFDACEQAIVALARAMTLSVRVPEETLKAARAALSSDRDLVEIVGVIAAYNMVSRFLVALRVDPE